MEIADSYLCTGSFSSQNEEHDKKQRIDKQRFEFSFQSSQTKDLEAVITNLASEWGAGMN